MAVGGAADLLVKAATPDDVLLAIQSCEDRDVDWALLGAGTNVLVNDDGFRGLVIANVSDKVTREGDTLTADAGIRMASLCAKAARGHLSGLEFLSGIPGTLGGSVAMNAHFPDPRGLEIAADGTPPRIRGRRVSECVGNVELARLHGGRPSKETIPLAEYSDRYPDGPGSVRPDHVVLRVALGLRPDAEKGIRDSMERARRYRSSRELWDPSSGSWKRVTSDAGEPQGRSLGCIFRNPPGASAGRLIQDADCKGLTCGGAVVSTRHANYIMNYDGKATAADICQLIEEIRERVWNQHQVWLQEEILYLPPKEPSQPPR
jgi:UDP-N-acetylmuramate dehydrogenase